MREDITKLDALIQAQGRYGSERKELERARKAKEELTKTNDQIKNQIQSKQNEKEGFLSEVNGKIEELQKELKKLSNKKITVETLLAERKKTLTSGLVSDNKELITTHIDKLYEIFEKAQLTTLDLVPNQFRGLKGL